MYNVFAFYLPIRSSLGLLKSKLEKYQEEMGDEKEKEMKLEQDLRDKEWDKIKCTSQIWPIELACDYMAYACK